MNLTQALQIIFCFSSDIQERTRCEHIIANNTAIIERVTPEYGVSPVLIASICAKESRLGIDPRAASICGTKIHHRYVSDPESSIRITANTMRHRACRSLPLSLSSFRGYGCRSSSYATEILSIQRRIRCAMSTGQRCGGLRRGRVQSQPGRAPRTGESHRPAVRPQESESCSG